MTTRKTDTPAPNSNLIPFQRDDLVRIAGNGKAVTTSMSVANKFEKNHKDVLRTIENLECSDEFSRRNFALSDYINMRGKKYPMFLMTRDGFTILAMGFTGKRAMEWKEKYIAAFNRLEKRLYEGQIASEVNHIALKVGDIDRKLDWLSEIRQKHNPVADFASKHCEIGLENRILKSEIYYIYKGYCVRKGIYALHKNVFFKHLYAHAGYIKPATVTISDKCVPAVRGIRLKKEVPYAG